MRRLFVTLLILAVMPAYSEGLIFYQDSTATEGRVIPVSDLTPLPVNADVSIGSITVEAFPVFADSTGEPATATVDADHRAVVNIGSDSIGLLDKLDEIKTATASETKLIDSIKGVPTNCSINTVSIPGNTMLLMSPLPNNVAISIFNNSDSATLWFRSDDVDVTVGNGIPVQPKGFISFKHGSSPNIKIIADSAMSVTTYKEGR